MGKSAPQAATPDPYKTAAAQTGSNVQTAIANSVLGNANENSPYGSVKYTQTGSSQIRTPRLDERGNQIKDASGNPVYDTNDVPQYQRDVTLSPEQQGLYNQQTKLQSGLNDLGISQINKVGGILGQNLDLSGLPGMGRLPGNTATLMSGGWSPQQMVHSLPVERADGTIGNSGAVMDTVNLNNQSGVIGNAGAITRGVNLGNQSQTFGDAGDIQRSIGPTDYEGARKSVEDALYSRLNPQLDRDRAGLENRLVNQGFQRGTQAFDEAMNEYGRQANDARQQVVLAGGQEQSRLAGLDLAKGQFANTAQQQSYNQQAGRGQFANDAIAANNAAQIAGGQFANTAQQQQFGQNQAQQQAVDAATAANNQARIAEGTFYNAGQAQRFGQNTTAMEAANAAAGQNNAANAAAYQFYNQAQQQGYDQDIGRRSFDNTANQANFNNQLALANAQTGQRGVALQEALTQRQTPLNEIIALMGGGQVQQPNFANYQGGQVANTPVGEYVYQSNASDARNAQIQAQQQNAMLTGLFGMGSAGMYGGMRGLFGKA